MTMTQGAHKHDQAAVGEGKGQGGKNKKENKKQNLATTMQIISI